jgi:hypothetical protein
MRTSRISNNKITTTAKGKECSGCMAAASPTTVTAVNCRCGSRPKVTMIPVYQPQEQAPGCLKRSNAACPHIAASHRSFVATLDGMDVPMSPVVDAKQILFRRWFPMCTETNLSCTANAKSSSHHVHQSPIQRCRRSLFSRKTELVGFPSPVPVESDLVSGDRWSCTGSDDGFVPPKKPVRQSSDRRLME